MLIFFTRQLYILIKAGIPLLKALQIVAAQLPAGKFRIAAERLAGDIQEGKSFSEALSAAAQYFSLFYVNMIKAAEVTGNLTGILKELSEHLSSHRKIVRQVQAALLYPILVLLLSVSILLVLMVFVVPVFVRIFQDLGGSMPPTTLFLMNISNLLIHWSWLFVLILAALAISAILVYRNSRRGRYFISGLIWSLPLFGRILKLLEISRLCRTLGTLLSSGVTLVKGLDVLIETTPGIILQEALQDIRLKIEQGKSLSAGMEEAGIFPLTLVRMIQVGEESGKIAELFLEAARDYEEEVSFAVNGMLSLLEPILIVVMGSVVGFIVISLFFPIFTISGLVK